jgi:fatty acid desaturase
MSQQMEATTRKPPSISWYRTPVDPAVLKKLHERSDFLGLVQSLSYLGVLGITGAAAWYASIHWSWIATALLLFLHGTVSSFLINAVHEISHGTVFKTKWLTALFVRVFSFLGWIHFEMFQASHARHHRYTLHPPDDLEVVLPLRLMVRHFFLEGFVHYKWFFQSIRNTVRIALGKFRGEWELVLFPEPEPGRRRAPIRWARILLLGHGAIILVSAHYGLWILPMILTFAPFYGGWIFFLCNNTQHIGLQDNVPDFRLCCRTFTLNPVLRFLYWHMNYHTEHHMYAAVPCYRLGKLHKLIRHDLPPTPHGLVATWREIATIQKRQDEDPTYQHAPPLPQRS